MEILNNTPVPNWRFDHCPAVQPEPKAEAAPPPSTREEPLDCALMAVQGQLQRLLDASGERRTYAHKVLEQRLKVLEALSAGMIEGNDDVVAGQRSIVNQVIGELPDEVRAQAAKVPGQVPEFFDKLIELINLIGKNYLSIYQNIVQKFSTFFDAFNSQVTSKLQQWMEAVNEGKDIKLDVAQLKKALQDLMTDDKLDLVLFKGGREEAIKWRDALGAPMVEVDGEWVVQIDLDPLKQMLKDLDELKLDEDGKVVLDSASFQAWQTGFNAQTERLKNKLQEFTQKYSSANSTHDNFIKVLSNHINQFADMLKSMVHT